MNREDGENSACPGRCVAAVFELAHRDQRSNRPIITSPGLGSKVPCGNAKKPLFRAHMDVGFSVDAISPRTCSESPVSAFSTNAASASPEIVRPQRMAERSAHYQFVTRAAKVGYRQFASSTVSLLWGWKRALDAFGANGGFARNACLSDSQCLPCPISLSLNRTQHLSRHWPAIELHG